MKPKSRRMPPDLFHPEVVIVDGLYLMKPKRKPMRDFCATRLDVIEPVQFHHQHDTGTSDLHVGRFSVAFDLLRADADWGRSVVDWATDNCAGPFELQNIEPRPWDSYSGVSPRDHARTARWERSLLFANESDATLAYLRFK